MAYTTINKGSSYFNTILYTGTGSNLAVTGVGFKPDLVWDKSRSAAEDHVAYDIVRGSTARLSPNTTGAEFVNATQGMQSFDTDGFTCGVSDQYNKSAQTQVAWNWLASNTTASNTSGSITSTVSANTTAGFSIVSWTGTGNNSDQTLGTGLSTSLDFIITKPRDSGGGTDQWLVYTSAVTLNQNECFLLNATNGKITGASSGTPSRGSTAGQLKLYAGTVNNQNLNTSGLKYIAYCFAAIKGFSKFGSYSGNSSTDGPFIYTGFKPAFVLTKNTSTTGNWQLEDNKRDPYNVNQYRLYPNLTNAEASSTDGNLDFLSNGFKPRTADGGFNGSGSTYIYMAFAENPFVSSTSIPTTAR
jgi:hypothetical protein